MIVSRVAILASIACISLACSRSAPQTTPRVEPRPESRPGTNGSATNTATGMFDYGATIKGVELRGRFAINGNLVIFELPESTCRPMSSADWTVSGMVGRYECRSGLTVAPVYFTVDLRNPTGRSTWQMTVTEQRQRTVCLEYVSRNGRNVCSRSQTEHYDVAVPLSGPLMVRRTVAARP